MLGLFILIFSVSQVNALNIHEEASEKAKVVFEVQAGDKLIPIIKHGEWLKVANPKDGKVGWVKVADLQGHLSLNNGINYQQRIITNKSDHGVPNVYRVIDYTGPNKMSQEEMDEIFKQMQARQEQIQKYMQAMLQSMFNSFQSLQQVEPFSLDNNLATVPTIIVPEKGSGEASCQGNSNSNSFEKSKNTSIINKVKHAFTNKTVNKQTQD